MATSHQTTSFTDKTRDQLPDQDEKQAIVVPIRSEGDVLVARSVTLKISAPLGFSVVELTQIQTAASELATNLVRYASTGRISVKRVDKDDNPGVEITATDDGPGIEDVAQAMTDGYSTGKSLGVGLPGVKRLMDDFEIRSKLGEGTTVTTAKYRRPWIPAKKSPPCIDWAVAARSKTGEPVSGDTYVVEAFGGNGNTLVAVIDGLGHGADAAEPSRMAAEILKENAGKTVETLMRHCDEGLRRTRGAVATVVSITTRQNALQWSAIGNVEAAIVQTGGDATGKITRVIPRNGVLGLNAPRPVVNSQNLAVGDLLIMATDGIESRFPSALDMSGKPRVIAEDILRKFGKMSDDALVLVARYTGARS